MTFFEVLETLPPFLKDQFLKKVEVMCCPRVSWYQWMKPKNLDEANITRYLPNFMELRGEMHSCRSTLFFIFSDCLFFSLLPSLSMSSPTTIDPTTVTTQHSSPPLLSSLLFFSLLFSSSFFFSSFILSSFPQQPLLNNCNNASFS